MFERVLECLNLVVLLLRVSELTELYVVIGGGLALNDIGFILVQAMCPTSSLSRSMILFLSPGA